MASRPMRRSRKAIVGVYSQKDQWPSPTEGWCLGGGGRGGEGRRRRVGEQHYGEGGGPGGGGSSLILHRCI